MSLETTAYQSGRSARRRARADIWRRFRASVPGMTGLVLLLIFAVMAVAYPILIRTAWDPAIYDPETGIDLREVDMVYVEEVTDPSTQVGRVDAFLADPFAQPGDVVTVRAPAGIGLDHLLSTDPWGHDVLAMLLAGATSAFVMAIAAALTTALVAIVIAAIAAFYDGWIDTVLSNTSAALLLLPAPLLMIILGTSDLGSHIGPFQFGLIYGLLAGAGAAAIVVRSQAVQTMQRPFIDAARAAGAGSTRIVLRHLVPHLIPLAAVSMLIGVTGAIVADAFVSFLAFGENRFSWGTMLNAAIRFPSLRGLFDTPWHLLIAGGLAISLLAAAFYLVAIGLHAAIDTPRSKRS
jgi:ABC-type dipeptide/oligopeptide/nickel transport system permease subunit